jgi:hypothetical protein
MGRNHFLYIIDLIYGHIHVHHSFGVNSVPIPYPIQNLKIWIILNQIPITDTIHGHRMGYKS